MTLRATSERAWRRAAFCLFAVAAGTNVPTPLLLVYRDTLDLSPDVLTAVFGSYAVGLVPALFLAGPASDRLGRRRLVVVFSALAGLTSLLLVAAASSLPLLFVGRCLQGAVSGADFTVGSAWLTELSGPAAGQAAGRRAAVAMTGGFSLGPLTAGVLAEYGPAPTTLPYLVHVVLVACGVLVARTLPETVVRRQRGVGPPGGPLVEPHERRVLLTVLLPLSVCVYAFPSVVISAVPLLVETTAPPVLLTGVLAGLTLGSGTLAAPLQRRLGAVSAPVGVLAGSGGYALAALGSGSGSPPVLLAAAVLLGGGSGLVLAGGLALAARLARPERRGALSAAFYGCAYVGFSAPLLTALAAEATSVQVPLAVGAALALALAVRLAVAARRGQLGQT
ncbi:MAG TPA: MFS transporter [Mycobacteriales bacterium]|nr:MFS transporter [Mycobacteriales bacterium]